MQIRVVEIRSSATMATKSAGMPRRMFRFVPVFCFCGSVVFVLTTLLNSAGVYVQGYVGFEGLLTLDLIFLLGLPCAAAFAAVAALKRRMRGTAILLLLFQSAVLLATYSGVAVRLVEDWNFRSRLLRRVEAVELARADRLSKIRQGPCDCYYAALPPVYSNLSSGGEVLVSRHRGGFSVTFFASRAGLFDDDDYTGFVFRERGDPQSEEDDTYRYLRIRKLRPQWFHVRHT